MIDLALLSLVFLASDKSAKDFLNLSRLSMLEEDEMKTAYKDLPSWVLPYSTTFIRFDCFA